jgi:cysteine synthase A
VAARVAENVLELIGLSPMVRLKCEGAACARVYAKFELANPGGSVKDRIALSMLLEAESRGLLQGPQACVVEPTSGNTGIGLAMVSAVKGYRCVLVMPEGLPKKRYALPKAYGAELVLTPFELGMKGAVDKAQRLLEENPGWFCPMQFSNRANPAMHRKTTAQEILKAFKNGVDAFVAGVGTGGTLTGVAQVLKKKNPRVRVVAVEPKGSAVLSGGAPGPHRIQGIGAGFVPAVLNMRLVDEVIQVTDTDALATAKSLARSEGLLVGVSSGANAWAARQVARKLGKDKIVVTLLCDRGEPYLTDDGEWE